MTFPPSAIQQVLAAVGALLGGDGSGFTWRDPADGVAYETGEVGVYVGTMSDSAGAQLVLNWATIDDGLEAPRTQGSLQITSIGAPHDTWTPFQMSDAVRQILHGLTHHPVTDAVDIIQAYRSTSTDLGEDTAYRTAIADRYTVDVALPATVNPPV